MNCRHAHDLISAERDGTLDETRRAALAAHLADCGECRTMRTQLETAAQSWRRTAATVAVPDRETEWRAIRRRLHAPADPAARGASRRPWLAWAGVPLAATAAVALAALVVPDWFGRSPTDGATITARVEYLELGDNSNPTMVYVDQSSGWLYVWTNEQMVN